MVELAFTKTDVENYFDNRTLSRGRSYWRGGYVRDLGVKPDGSEITAKVQGSESKPYEVTIDVVPEVNKRSGAITIMFETGCSCPVGYECKHAVAACLKALEVYGEAKNHETKKIGTGSGTFYVAPSGSVATALQALSPSQRATVRPPYAPPDPTDEWLKSLEAKSSAASAERTEKKKSIVYIVEANGPSYAHHHQVRLRAMIAPILKDGRFGKPQNASYYQIIESNAHYSSPEDRTIGRMMRGGNGYDDDVRSPPMEADFFDILFRQAIATGRCFLDSLDSGSLVPGDERQGSLGWTTEGDGSQSPTIVAHEDPTRFYILPAQRPWYVDIATRQAGPLRFDAPLALVHKYLEGPSIRALDIPRIAEKMAEKKLAPSIAPPAKITIEKRQGTPVPCLRLFSAWLGEDDRKHHFAAVHFDYDGVEVDPPSAPDFLRRCEGTRMIVTERNRKAEGELLSALLRDIDLFAASYSPPGIPKGRLAFAFPEGTHERMNWLDFLSRRVPELRAEGWRVGVEDSLDQTFKTVEADNGDGAWDANMREQEGGMWWFSLELGILVEGQRIPLLPLLVQALKRVRDPLSSKDIERLSIGGKVYVDLPDGRALALPFARVKDILATLIELYDQPLNPDGSLTVPLDLAAALQRIDAATEVRWLGGQRLKALIERLRTFKGLVEILPPKGLKATLRPYQREGLNWLQFLRDYGLGGILADDMGLGKTVQALAHILVEKQGKRLKRPVLIVCPTSLIPNWQSEAEKFAPSLKVLSLHGKDRAERFRQIDDADVVLTTYPLLPRDTETLSPLEWHMVILDEAQAIKNPTSQATQLVCGLKTKHRLCLTGTPIENHLGEAWSHFAFLMPGMLGRHKDFTKRFRIPIEKHNDRDRSILLSRRLKPFILRRNKSEVAKELPPKTEIIRAVEFDQAQRDLYETLRVAMQEKVQQAVADKGLKRSKIEVLAALTKLRLACCDPRLVKLPSAKKAKRSAKLDCLMEMLPEMIEEGRRVLLFSQYTSMLDLIKPKLGKAKIPFVEIRGDTRDRRTPVTQFQNGDVPLFLISLKAGGTGLNLTAADTVILFDPWWNPAVENQAIDRAHRIGQDKPVFVYKLIAKGTVEDRILKLQGQKRALAESLLEERDETSSALDAADLEDLGFLFEEAA
jgi:superfamily II DNA or RNA helicase